MPARYGLNVLAMTPQKNNKIFAGVANVTNKGLDK
jgi:hypothetical protein